MNLSTIQKIPNPATRQRLLAKHTQQLRVNRVRDQILSCTNCGLHENVRKPVPWSGPIPSQIVFVGEGPGAEEDRFGVPFVGKAGQLFDHLLTQARLDRDQVMVTNIICCRPPSNRDPLPSEIAACRPNLVAQLDLSGTWVGVTLGAFALGAITARNRSAVKVMSERGKPIAVDGRIWIPTLHPAYALRNPAGSKLILDDIRAAKRLLEGMETLPTQAFLNMAMTTDNGRDLLESMEKNYAVWKLNRIEDTVVVVKHEGVVVPDELSHLVVYTLEELIRLGEIGKESKFTAEDYKHVHLVKKQFGAMVVGG